MTYRYAFDLYQPERPKCEIDLSDNTNKWGSAPSAIEVLSNAIDVAGLPDPYSAKLKEVLAKKWKVPIDQVVVGAGSDDLLNSAMRGLAKESDTLLYCAPTFGMADVFAKVNRLQTVEVELLSTGELDVDAMLSARAELAYICTPNNPTGLPVSEQCLRMFLDHFPGVTIVDEAYAEYCDQKLIPLADEYDRLFVVRTFSKAWGLAGLRVGYGFGAPEIISQVEKARGPYKVGTLSETAAVAALSNDEQWMKVYVDSAIGGREKLLNELIASGYKPLSSMANFVLIPVPDAKYVFEQLTKSQVLVRAYEALPSLGDAIRVTVAPDNKMNQFISAFESVLL